MRPDFDLKIAGLAHTIPLVTPDGNTIHREFPGHHSSLPSDIQNSFDFMSTRPLPNWPSFHHRISLRESGWWDSGGEKHSRQSGGQI